tara:strand:- start:1937 stop:2974 length:1038 start_codon:yes stop_codon:yes gene_type:complete
MARRTIDQLYALTIPEVQKVFLNVMQDVVDSAILSEMVAAIEAGDAEALFRATGFTPASLGPILDRIEKSYSDGAELTVEGWPRPIRTPTGLTVFRFDMRNPIAEQDLKQFSSGFVTRLTDEARNNVRTTLEQGMIRGQNPRKTALDIVGRIDPKTKKRVGGIIGLNEAQVGWVDSTRRRLEQLDKSYFKLTLRDKRFDATVRNAIESGKPIPTDTIDKLITSYKKNALRYRGQAVARTETIQSINRGAQSAYIQAVGDGTLQRKALTKEWDDVGGSLTRTTHSSMGKTYGKGKGIDLEEPFVSPSGDRLMHPGDSKLGAGPAEIVFCRCKTVYRVDWVENARQL